MEGAHIIPDSNFSSPRRAHSEANHSRYIRATRATRTRAPHLCVVDSTRTVGGNLMGNDNEIDDTTIDEFQGAQVEEEVVRTARAMLMVTIEMETYTSTSEDRAL